MLRWQPAPSSPFSSSSSSLFCLLLLVVPACRHCRRRSASTSSSSSFRLHLLPLVVPAPPPRRSVAFVRSPAGWMWFGVVSLGGVGCVSDLWSFVVLPAGLRHPSRWYSIGNNNDKIKTYLLRVPNIWLGTRWYGSAGCRFLHWQPDAFVVIVPPFAGGCHGLLWLGTTAMGGAVGSRYLQEKNKNNKKR